MKRSGALLATHAPIPPAKRVEVQSSNLAWVAYDASHQTLSVSFKGGRTYQYSGVPAGLYHGLLDAYSKGRYFHLWIQDRYPYKKT